MHFLLLLVVLPVVYALYALQCGDGCFYECPSTYPLLVDICASGDDVACGYPATETSMLCGTVQDLLSYSKVTSTYLTDGYWRAATGGFIECNYNSNNEVAYGYCGSHSNKDCSGGIYGVACGRLQYPLFTVKNGATRYGPTSSHDTYCPSGTVMCGHCSSGKGHDCDGSTNQMQCCAIVDCTPTNITGTWQFVKAGSSPDETVTTTIGIDVTATVGATKTLHESVEVEIGAGFYFYNVDASVSVDGSFSKTVSVMASASISISATRTSEARCDFAPYVLYQYQITVEGPCGEKIYLDAYACTKTLAAPPRCLPGYALDAHYQVCVPGSPQLPSPVNDTSRF